MRFSIHGNRRMALLPMLLTLALLLAVGCGPAAPAQAPVARPAGGMAPDELRTLVSQAVAESAPTGVTAKEVGNPGFQSSLGIRSHGGNRPGSGVPGCQGCLGVLALWSHRRRGGIFSCQSRDRGDGGAGSDGGGTKLNRPHRHSRAHRDHRHARSSASSSGKPGRFTSPPRFNRAILSIRL